MADEFVSHLFLVLGELLLQAGHECGPQREAGIE